MRTREAQAAKPTAPSLERFLLAMHFPTLSTLRVSLDVIFIIHLHPH